MLESVLLTNVSLSAVNLYCVHIAVPNAVGSKSVADPVETIIAAQLPRCWARDSNELVTLRVCSSSPYTLQLDKQCNNQSVVSLQHVTGVICLRCQNDRYDQGSSERFS